jgi:nucleotide-binding universal stress UspA family protein
LKRSGKVADEITAAANEYNVDLIAMATQGHKGVFGAIHGSVTEQVLTQVRQIILKKRTKSTKITHDQS